MAEKDMNSKVLEDLNDVFADIVNVLLFNGEEIISADSLSETNVYSNYTANGKIREQERDVAKYWDNSRIHIAKVGLENETEEEPDMPLRVFNYDAAAYRAQFSPPNRNSRFPVVTLVLYFGYKKRWEKAKTLYDNVDVPECLTPYVNDYRMNLFEIAYLSDEQVAMFKSDFRYVADYYVQLRKNGEYVPKPDIIEHVSELLSMMKALTGDERYTQAYEELKGKERVSMCEVLDKVESRGIDAGSTKRLIEQVCKKLAKGKSIGTIADEVEETVESIKPICNIAEKHAPNYDVDAIYDELRSK